MKEEKNVPQVRQSRFPVSLFAILFGILLLMSGIHTGLIVWLNLSEPAVGIQVLLPMVYWALVAGGVTLYTRRQMRKVYEIPMQTLARATSRVAHGDFSVYVPTINTPDKWDYFDVMLMDFNIMVEELGSMEVLKTDFFSNVSHEIKTPLAVISNNAQLLDKDNIPEEKRQEYVRNIRKASKKLADLIMNMLKLNKLEKQAIRPAPEEFDLCRQVCECALQFEDAWDDKEIELDVDIEDRLMIEADPGLLELVWTNLLSNAVKFTPKGGSVTLKEISDEQNVTVSVTDTGCGMDEATQRHIYDKFFQGDSSHSTEGNGLGLSLVQRILELSEGSISVESAVGQGTTFTVTLPLRPSDISYEDDTQEES